MAEKERPATILNTFYQIMPIWFKWVPWRTVTVELKVDYESSTDSEDTANLDEVKRFCLLWTRPCIWVPCCYFYKQWNGSTGCTVIYLLWVFQYRSPWRIFFYTGPNRKLPRKTIGVELLTQCSSVFIKTGWRGWHATSHAGTKHMCSKSVTVSSEV